MAFLYTTEEETNTPNNAARTASAISLYSNFVLTTYTRGANNEVSTTSENISVPNVFNVREEPTEDALAFLERALQSIESARNERSVPQTEQPDDQLGQQSNPSVVQSDEEVAESSTKCSYCC